MGRYTLQDAIARMSEDAKRRERMVQRAIRADARKTGAYPPTKRKAEAQKAKVPWHDQVLMGLALTGLVAMAGLVAWAFIQ